MNTSIPMINSAADLAVAAPYLVGYHPDDELVTVAYGDARFLLGGTVGLDVAARHGYAFTIGSTLHRRGIRRVLLVGYGPEAAVTPIMLEAKDACTELGILIGEALRIEDGHWWSYLAPDHTAGTLIEADSALAAAFVAAGSAPLDSPAAVAAQLAPADDEHADAMNSAVHDAKRRIWQRRARGDDDALIAEGVRIGQHVTRTGTLSTDDETALLGALLAAPRIRGEVCAAAVVAIDDSPPEKSVPVWAALTRILPNSCRWQAAALTGFAAWRAGNGVLARHAIRISLSLNSGPDNGLALSMADILATGTAPFEIATLTADDLDDPDA